MQIDASATFSDLHRVIQVAFDWEDYHMHEFHPDKSNGHKIHNAEIKPVKDAPEIDEPALFPQPDVFEETEEVLSDWFVQRNDKVTYIYDFGDDWFHDIVLTNVVKRDTERTYPYCSKVRNLAPPEDSRGELIEGEIDLERHETEDERNKINDVMEQAIDDAFPDEPDGDVWPDLLAKAKEFSKLKPWETMADNDIFAVVDPVSGEMLFCSVLGAGDDTFGLGVYIGKAGYSVLLDVLEGVDNTFDTLLRQRSFLMSFEDREDLHKKDYELIKQYGVTFRGRKAWPAFLSMKPGTEPWSMEPEEVRTMLVAIGEAIDVYKQVKGGLELPDVYLEDQVLARVPEDEEGTVLENKYLDLTDYEDDEPETPALAISELEIKRMQKIRMSLPTVLEFSIVHLDMPVQNNPGERPVFPMLVIGIDESEGTVGYQNLVMGSADAGDIQRELLYMLEGVGGIPETLMMDPKTAFSLESVIDTLGLEVDIQESLPLVDRIVEELEQNLPEM